MVNLVDQNLFLELSVCLCSPARALAAGLPRQDHVYKTTDESIRFHNKKIDEMRSTHRVRSRNTQTHLKCIDLLSGMVRSDQANI